MTYAQRDAAERTLFGYCRALDRLDEALLRGCFHPDARIELGGIYSGGPEGFVGTAMAFMGAMAATRHEVTNFVTAPHTEGVAVEAYVRAWHLLDTPEGTQELIVLARYLDVLVEREGEWLIWRHGEVMDWGEMRPVSRGWFDANTELEKGRRDRSDPSYRWLASPPGS